MIYLCVVFGYLVLAVGYILMAMAGMMPMFNSIENKYIRRPVIVAVLPVILVVELFSLAQDVLIPVAKDFCGQFGAAIKGYWG